MSDDYFIFENRRWNMDELRNFIAENDRLRTEIEKLRAALDGIEEYISGRVHMHNQIAGAAGSSLAGKKQRVRASEASDILGKIRAAIRESNS